jgi:hypothetical protein
MENPTLLHVSKFFCSKNHHGKHKKSECIFAESGCFHQAMLLGVGIALALIVLFLAGVDEPDPA